MTHTAEADIGWHYLEGVGVSKDLTSLLFKWFKRRSRNKIIRYAQANLGWMIANGDRYKKRL